MASSTAPVIDSAGISAPGYADALDYLQTKFRSIYGDDIYIEADSQDGQFLGVLALAISDANAAVVASYNARSPLTAQGNGLSSVVKINGIGREVATSSQVDLRIVGQAGTTITNGKASDENGNQWALPASVTIPPAGEITVTATCTKLGDVSAAIGAINTIATPTRGWQSVTNPSAATAGAPVETDAALRQKQKISVALPSRTVFEGIKGAVASVAGVTRSEGYENDTSFTDADGLPRNTIAMAVEGGDAMTIAQVIAAKKGPGAGTYGDTAETVLDVYGRPIIIRFFRPTYVTISASIGLRALSGYNSSIGASIQQAVSDYINSVRIGGGESKSVEWGDAITAANSVSGSSAFKITSLTISRPSGTGTPDVPLAFNEASACTPADVALTVT